ncbi:hypothetical protein [Nocardioides sp.]|uniref:hypothetical protein n=1 Tax=Nocardioides sp. TaxID=35761 RepID=UPI002715CE52|nr:hypothetical protein [Nocardioides sp.]MDO9458318.1 hypothetical protein [Nocardioides sp.]
MSHHTMHSSLHPSLHLRTAPTTTGGPLPSTYAALERRRARRRRLAALRRG